MSQSWPRKPAVRPIDITELSFQLKKQRDFLKWMARRYKETDPEKSAAFTTGAELFNNIRQDLRDGYFDEEA